MAEDDRVIDVSSGGSQTTPNRSCTTAGYATARGYATAISSGYIANVSTSYATAVDSGHIANAGMGRATAVDNCYTFSSETVYTSVGSGSSQSSAISGSAAIVLEPLTARATATATLVRLCRTCGDLFQVLGSENYCSICSKVVASPDEGEWFRFVCFCIPKSIAEPWLGDLREHRVTMIDEGYSRSKVEWATAIEVVTLILSWLVQTLLKIATPFKND